MLFAVINTVKNFPCVTAKFPVFSLSGKSKNQIPCSVATLFLHTQRRVPSRIQRFFQMSALCREGWFRSFISNGCSSHFSDKALCSDQDPSVSVCVNEPQYDHRKTCLLILSLRPFQSQLSVSGTPHMSCCRIWKDHRWAWNLSSKRFVIPV